MFTGIIEAIGEVKSRTDNGITVSRPAHFDDIKIGSSICVSGVCLSIIDFDKKTMRFDVVPTTFKKSKLGSLKKGDTVNLERAMKVDGRFDGHIVQGHCEATAIVAAIRKSQRDIQCEIHLPSSLQNFIVRLGPVTVDGVSLTVADCDKKIFTVALVPHTLQNTTLGALKTGNQVNLETDILGKYITKIRQ